MTMKKLTKVCHAEKSEAWVKDQVKLLCRKYDASYTMPVAGPWGRSGVSDFLICHAGRYIAVETKTETNKATPLQLGYLDEIKRAGGIGLVVRPSNLDELERVLSLSPPPFQFAPSCS